MRKSSVIIIAIVTVFVVFLGYKYFSSEESVANPDAVTFKKEYEVLNNRINKSNNKVYPEVNISTNNVIKYSTYDELLEIIKSGTGVIYLGYPECPWCRNLVPTMLMAANEVSLDTIYYLNIKEDRDLMILDENKKVVTKKEGSKNYYELVDALSSILDDYILTTNQGEEVNTGKKRIYVPIIILIKDGKIIGHHVDTVESQKDPYVLLSDVEQEELLLKLINLMSYVSGNVCDERC